ncbi:hypothetical protein ILUMI_03191 [Ignelater luminosus]|uniref:DDE-1 domain-containing protein n=1 Tax=Ignelater luminosus TaxID=2038154 RepID=A0A8K0DH01_IGNLU|nr:hypothetical protein ILUMI_03191 [Ignelater luminosus]
MATSSGRSNVELFVKYLEHFISVVKPLPDHEMLFVMDNHERHLLLEAINLVKNSIIILTFPPHTSHKLQPLGRTVFGAFKTYYNKACKNWILSHPGKPNFMYDVAQLVDKAFPLAFALSNITAGFRVTGIRPFNEEVFGDDEFLPSKMTNRPYKLEPAEH